MFKWDDILSYVYSYLVTVFVRPIIIEQQVVILSACQLSPLNLLSRGARVHGCAYSYSYQLKAQTSSWGCCNAVQLLFTKMKEEFWRIASGVLVFILIAYITTSLIATALVFAYVLKWTNLQHTPFIAKINKVHF